MSIQSESSSEKKKNPVQKLLLVMFIIGLVLAVTGGVIENYGPDRYASREAHGVVSPFQWAKAHGLGDADNDVWSPLWRASPEFKEYTEWFDEWVTERSRLHSIAEPLEIAGGLLIVPGIIALLVLAIKKLGAMAFWKSIKLTGTGTLLLAGGIGCFALSLWFLILALTWSGPGTFPVGTIAPVSVLGIFLVRSGAKKLTERPVNTVETIKDHARDKLQREDPGSKAEEVLESTQEESIHDGTRYSRISSGSTLVVPNHLYWYFFGSLVVVVITVFGAINPDISAIVNTIAIIPVSSILLAIIFPIKPAYSPIFVTIATGACYIGYAISGEFSKAFVPSDLPTILLLYVVNAVVVFIIDYYRYRRK